MVNKTKTVEFIRFFNPKTHKLIFKMPTVDSSSILLDSEIRQSVPFSVYSEIYNAITGKELESDGFLLMIFVLTFWSSLKIIQMGLIVILKMNRTSSTFVQKW